MTLEKVYDMEVEKFNCSQETLKRKMPEVIVVTNRSTQRESLDVVLRTLQEKTKDSSDSRFNTCGEIVFVENLHDAWERMGVSEPALVILDVSEIDRWVVQQLTQIKGQYPRVKMVVLADLAPWQTFKKLPGLDGLLLKGFSSIQLTKLIIKLLNPNLGTASNDSNDNNSD